MVDFLSANRLASRAIRNRTINYGDSENSPPLGNLLNFNTALNTSQGLNAFVPSTALNTRIIDNLAAFSSGQSQGGILDNIWNWGKTLFGWINNFLNIGAFSFTAVYSWILSTVEQLKAFDWNATDQELKAVQNSINVQLASIWGGIAGKTFGYTVGIGVSYGVSLVVPVIGSALVAKGVATKVAQEAWEDLSGDLSSAIKLTGNLWTQQGLLSLYMNTRNVIKAIPLDNLTSIVGTGNANWIKQVWGEPNAPTLTFNAFVDDKVESIKNLPSQAFVEEFLEESYDAFVEAGYIMSQELDRYLEEYRQARRIAQGPIRNVQVLPDGNTQDEYFSLRGIPEETVIQTTQNLLNNHRLLNNRNVGMIVAGDYHESVSARPMLRKLVIEFSERPAPPWVMPNNKVPRRSFVAIPDIKVGTTWNQIKKAAKAYMWGRFRATVHLANRRQIVVYGETREIALMKAEELADLSASEKLRTHCSEEVDVPTKQKKEPRMMYPKVARLMHRTNSMDGNGNIIINSQYYDTEILSFLLWTEDEPPNTPSIT